MTLTPIDTLAGRTPIWACFRCMDTRRAAGQLWHWCGGSSRPRATACIDCGERYPDLYEPARMLVVEFDDALLPTVAIMEVVTQYGNRRTHEICCNPSKAHGCVYYHDSGSGPSDGTPYHIGQIVIGGSVDSVPPTPENPHGLTLARHYYWGHPSVVFDVRSTTAERLSRLPDAFPESAFIVGVGDDTETVYCHVCDDSFPREVGSTCQHLEWCDKCDDWRGPGMVPEDTSCIHTTPRDERKARHKQAAARAMYTRLVPRTE